MSLVRSSNDPSPVLAFDEIWRRAEVLARSGLVPDDLRGKPADIVLVVLTGQELGFSMAYSLKHVYVVKGKTELDAQGSLALLKRHGHEARFEFSDATEATIKGRRREDRNDPEGWVTVTYTMDQAERANLTEYSNGKPKEVWAKFPAEMLRARAATTLCKMHFSDVLAGMGIDNVVYDDYEITGGEQESGLVSPPVQSPDALPTASAVGTVATSASGSVSTPASPTPFLGEGGPATAADSCSQGPSAGVANPDRTRAMRRLFALLNGLDIRDDEVRHDWASEALGARIDSFVEVTNHDLRLLIDYAEKQTKGEA